MVSEEELDAVLQANRQRLVVLFAGATWCGSCRATLQSVKVRGSWEGQGYARTAQEGLGLDALLRNNTPKHAGILGRQELGLSCAAWLAHHNSHTDYPVLALTHAHHVCCTCVCRRWRMPTPQWCS